MYFYYSLLSIPSYLCPPHPCPHIHPFANLFSGHTKLSRHLTKYSFETTMLSDKPFCHSGLPFLSLTLYLNLFLVNIYTSARAVQAPSPHESYLDLPPPLIEPLGQTRCVSAHLQQYFVQISLWHFAHSIIIASLFIFFPIKL